MTGPEADDTAEYLLGVAMRLAATVQLYDPQEAAELLYGRPEADGDPATPGLTADELRALPFIQAALVDITRTREELLAWQNYRAPTRTRTLTCLGPPSILLERPGDPPKSRGIQCGTRRGYLKHVREGDPPGWCWECDVANHAWERTQVRDRHAYEARVRDQSPPPAGTTDDPQEDSANAA